jgi:hypothetical protein
LVRKKKKKKKKEKKKKIGANCGEGVNTLDFLVSIVSLASVWTSLL